MGKICTGNTSTEAENVGQGRILKPFQISNFSYTSKCHTRICPEREVVIARSNNEKANYNKSLLNFGA